MKIVEVRAFPVTIPDSWTHYVFVRVSTDEGIDGWGECTTGLVSIKALVEELGEFLKGKDPFRIEEHWQYLYHLEHNIRGGIMQLSAISAIEMALWDIKGKALGVPVYELLGGRMRDRIWTYGRFDGVTPELAVERALSQTEEGFTALKGDPFSHEGIYTTPASERDAVAKVKAVREAVGDDVELMVEVHGRLTPSEAIRVGQFLEEYRPFFYEEPVPPQNVDAMVKVASALNIPLATGERLYSKWGFRELLEKDVVAVIQPDVGHAGGILELKKIAAMAEVYYVGFAPHNPYGPLNSIAAIQVDVCTPNFLIQEGGYKPWFDELLKEAYPCRQTDGYCPIPEKPGLGIELDVKALKKFPYRSDLKLMSYKGREWIQHPSRQQNTWI